jgi:hypothetical protein
LRSHNRTASGDVSRLLNGTCSLHNNDSICFDGLVLPVNVTGSSQVSGMIEDAVRGHRDFAYDAVIHMGLEDIVRFLPAAVHSVFKTRTPPSHLLLQARGLKLETFALNQAVPDNVTFGMQSRVASCLNNSDYDEPTAAPAVAGAPCELPTTADLGRLMLEEALRSTAMSSARRDAFILEAWSRNAGTYYCNGMASNQCASMRCC